MSESGNEFVQLTSNVERAADDAASSLDTSASADGVTTALGGMNRRSMLKAMAASAALPLLAEACVSPDSAPGKASAGASSGAGKVVAGKGPRGTPSDPVLINPKLPWEKVLTKPELVTLAAMCDTIIPADEKSPAASKLGAPDYINEHVSAPTRANDLVQVRGGIMWINGESMTRYSKPFHELSETERTAICDDICFVPNAKPGYVAASMFFDKVRDLTATAFYTTPEGWKDIGYIGNVALPEFKGAPPEVMQRLGLG